MLDKSQIEGLHQKLETPALLLDMAIMRNNVCEMQDVANRNNIRLRPHCKTHKSPQLATYQQSVGARGISVAKLSEAEMMFRSGISDIFIANQITQPLKLKRLQKLHQQAELIVGIDHGRQVDQLLPLFNSSSRPLKLRIEIDCGFNRCGLSSGADELTSLARRIQAAAGLELDGLFTHAGHAYAAKSTGEIENIARQEADEVVKAAQRLRKLGIEIATLSVGSTPTAHFVAEQTGITEFRPGNYIFYDGIQVGLGVAEYNQCALYVLATVISQPAADRIVCDAGSKALNIDRGAHSAQTVKGFGHLVNITGTIDRVSEEHGMIQLERPAEIKIGYPLLIIPNHACTVVNLYDNYICIEGGTIVQTLPILGRGKSQ